MSHGVDLNKVVEDGDTFKNLSLFEDYANTIVGKERVKSEIVYILNKFLPESYDREIFSRKSTLVFDHIVDQAMTGYNWVA